MEAELYGEMVPVPRAARFPIELQPPPGFRPLDPSTWPHVEGRLEYVGGKLLYMPPCGGFQGTVVVPISGVLDRWQTSHPELIVAGNEQGICLDGEVRGADAAVFHRDALGKTPEGFIRLGT